MLDLNLHLTKNTRYQVGELSVFDEFPLHIRNGRYTHTFFFNDADAVSRTIDYLYEVLENFEEHNYSVAEFDVDF